MVEAEKGTSISRGEGYRKAAIHYEATKGVSASSGPNRFLYPIENSRNSLLDIWNAGTAAVDITVYGSAQFRGIHPNITAPPHTTSDDISRYWVALPNGSSNVPAGTHFTETLTNPYYYILVDATAGTDSSIHLVLRSEVA